MARFAVALLAMVGCGSEDPGPLPPLAYVEVERVDGCDVGANLAATGLPDVALVYTDEWVTETTPFRVVAYPADGSDPIAYGWPGTVAFTVGVFEGEDASDPRMGVPCDEGDDVTVSILWD